MRQPRQQNNNKSANGLPFSQPSVVATLVLLALCVTVGFFFISSASAPSVFYVDSSSGNTNNTNNGAVVGTASNPQGRAAQAQSAVQSPPVLRVSHFELEDGSANFSQKHQKGKQKKFVLFSNGGGNKNVVHPPNNDNIVNKLLNPSRRNRPPRRFGRNNGNVPLPRSGAQYNNLDTSSGSNSSFRHHRRRQVHEWPNDPPPIAYSNCPDEDVYMALWLLMAGGRNASAMMKHNGTNNAIMVYHNISNGTSNNETNYTAGGFSASSPEVNNNNNNINSINKVTETYSQRPLVIVDVGINKGYSVAGVLEALDLTPPLPSSTEAAWNYDPKFASAKSEAERAKVTAQRTNINGAGFFSRGALALELHQYVHPRRTSELIGACREAFTPSLFDPSRSLARHPIYKQQQELLYLEMLERNTSFSFTNSPQQQDDEASAVVEAGATPQPPSPSAPYRRQSVIPFVPSIEVYGVDGMRAHADVCDRFYNSQNKLYVEHSTAKGIPHTNFKFQFFWAAVSSSEGTVKFPQGELGVETGSLAANSGEDVKLSTLSKLIPGHVEVIDLLLTDTEGFDFDVFEGARDRFFMNGKVAIYVFEVHWGKNRRSLRSVVLELESFGYDCYFPLLGHGAYLYQITPVATRYHPKFDQTARGWLNVLCAFTVGNVYPGLRETMDELTRGDGDRHRSEGSDLDSWERRFPWRANHMRPPRH